MVAPFEISHVQTDNGSEFEKHFREFVENTDIAHFHIYPKQPKMNGYIERFNQTIRKSSPRNTVMLLHTTLEDSNIF